MIATDKVTEVQFDDWDNDPEFIEGEEGGTNSWTQVCEKCASKHKFNPTYLEEYPIKGTICGVNGCHNEAKFYYDFNRK